MWATAIYKDYYSEMQITARVTVEIGRDCFRPSYALIWDKARGQQNLVASSIVF